MAVPKKKSSPMCRGHRNGHIKAKTKTIAVCGNCGGIRISHNACTVCGFYNGRQVFVPSRIKKQNRAKEAQE